MEIYASACIDAFGCIIISLFGIFSCGNIFSEIVATQTFSSIFILCTTFKVLLWVLENKSRELSIK